MKIRIIKSTNNEIYNYQSLFKKGIMRHGHDVEIIDNISPSPVDLYITWGVRNNDVIDYTTKNKKRYLVMERGFLDNRLKWISLGYDGLNGRADFCNSDITDMKRCESYFSVLLKDWKETKNKDYVLLIGQTGNRDMAVYPDNIDNWYKKIIKECNERNLTVLFRPHPKAKIKYINTKYSYLIDDNKYIHTSLDNVKCCVVYSSNSAVDAIMYGIPTITYDNRSTVYQITKHDMSDLYYKPDRMDWLKKMAYSQWLPEELENGMAWAHIKKGLEK